LAALSCPKRVPRRFSIPPGPKPDGSRWLQGERPKPSGGEAPGSWHYCTR
jgi:hypothetical protein